MDMIGIVDRGEGKWKKGSIRRTNEVMLSSYSKPATDVIYRTRRLQNGTVKRTAVYQEKEKTMTKVAGCCRGGFERK